MTQQISKGILIIATAYLFSSPSLSIKIWGILIGIEKLKNTAKIFSVLHFNKISSPKPLKMFSHLDAQVRNMLFILSFISKNQSALNTKK